MSGSKRRKRNSKNNSKDVKHEGNKTDKNTKKKNNGKKDDLKDKPSRFRMIMSPCYKLCWCYCKCLCKIPGFSKISLWILEKNICFLVYIAALLQALCTYIKSFSLKNGYGSVKTEEQEHPEIVIMGIERKLKEAEIRLSDKEHKMEIMEREKIDQITNLENENEKLRKDKENVLKRLKYSENEAEKLKKEKEDALTRLSELMGTKLRENNPAITNLNDPNRPMKLGDQFSELYENEWTDAYSDLNESKKLNLKEEETIAIVLNILKEIYQACINDVEEQLTEKRRDIKGGNEAEIESFLRSTKEKLKNNASKYIPMLCEKITGLGSTCSSVVRYKDYSLPYIKNCVKICYYAVVQDPPMHIDFEPGQIYDKQSFKEYTKSGTTVDYLVWPALYLHKGGPILCKGVVQPVAS